MDLIAQSVPAASLAGMIISIVVSIGLPIALLIIWKKKSGANIASFMIGCCVFIVAVDILEEAFHRIVISIAGSALTEDIWLYALYAGLAAALFEEVGRLFGMKYFMKRFLNQQNAVMFGIGHGGIEAVLLLGASSISNLVMSLMINNGQIGTILAPLDESLKQPTFDSLSVLWTTGSWMFYMGPLERISAIILHICLSYVVYKSVKEKNVNWLVSAIATHFAVDAGTVILTKAVDIPVWVFEIILLAAMGVLLWHIIKIYMKEKDSKEVHE